MLIRKYTLPKKFIKFKSEDEQAEAMSKWYEEIIKNQKKGLKRMGLEIQEKVRKIRLIEFILEKK